MTRQCARPGCRAVATATLAYDYQQRITWLDPLVDEAHPMSYDLCHDHAQAMTVPRGWRLEDRRARRGAMPRSVPPFEDAYAY